MLGFIMGGQGDLNSYYNSCHFGGPNYIINHSPKAFQLLYHLTLTPAPTWQIHNKL